MLIILLNWIFIFITCLGTGWLLLEAFRRFLKNDIVSYELEHVLLAGLFLVTFCGLLTNFAFPINGYFTYTVFFVSCLILFINRTNIIILLRQYGLKLNSWSPFTVIIFIAICSIAIIKSAAPSELIDEGGYYLPYIRWIEEYRLVPGIANIEDRMGFNSTFHIACAIFSLREFYSQGFYELNGFILIICCSYFIAGADRLLKKDTNYLVSDFIKTFCLFFLLRNMLTSSASDLINVFLANISLVLFIEKTEKNRLPQLDNHAVLIFICTLFLATVKFSSAALFLLFAFILLSSEKGITRRFIMFFVISVFFLSSWLIRTYYLTGWLIFPLYTIDLFDPNWKVPLEFVRSQYYFVQQFARLNVDRLDSETYAQLYPGFEWVKPWFRNLSLHETIITLVLAVSVIISIPMLFFKKYFRKGYLVVFIILLTNVAMWFYSFPAYRFGWPFIIVFVSLTSTLLLISSRYLHHYRISVLIILVFFTGQSFYKTIRESTSILANNLLIPVPMPAPSSEKHIFGSGLTASVAESYECWGISPPCLPRDNFDGLNALGSQVHDGFYYITVNDSKDD